MWNLLSLIIFMASNDNTSSSDYSTPMEYDSSSSPLPTPTPVHEPRHSYHTGHTPDKKKAKRTIFLSPNSKKKLDEIHHYQYHQMELQREMYYEQKVTSSRLNFLERLAMKVCGPSTVHEPSSSHRPSSSHQQPWDASPSPPQISPNTMYKENIWSPLQPYIENGSPKTPKKTPKKNNP